MRNRNIFPPILDHALDVVKALQPAELLRHIDDVKPLAWRLRHPHIHVEAKRCTSIAAPLKLVDEKEIRGLMPFEGGLAAQVVGVREPHHLLCDASGNRRTV